MKRPPAERKHFTAEVTELAETSGDARRKRHR